MPSYFRDQPKNTRPLQGFIYFTQVLRNIDQLKAKRCMLYLLILKNRLTLLINGKLYEVLRKQNLKGKLLNSVKTILSSVKTLIRCEYGSE